MTVLCSEPDTYGRLVTDRNWHTDELHVAKLLAVKRTVVNDSFWPKPGDEKTNNLLVRTSLI